MRVIQDAKSDEVDLSDLVPILSDDDAGYTLFLVEVGEDTEYSMEFKVYEVATWECDEDHTPAEIELYVSGFIKWDGCSHLWFGEHGNGYVHLCGKLDWEQHCELMMELLKLAKKTIKFVARG